MAEHPNVGRIKDAFAAFATGDLAVFNDVFAEDLLWHEGGRNQLSGDYRGRQAVFGFLGKTMEITQGSFHVHVHAVRGGRSVTVNAVDLMHLRDGKVTEVWTVLADHYVFDELIG